MNYKGGLCVGQELHPEESQALELICTGCTVKEAAEKLGTTAFSVNYRLRCAYIRLGVRTLPHAAAVFTERKLRKTNSLTAASSPSIVATQ